MRGGRMRGFMCQPHAATAVCVPGDPRSVVVPRRPDRILVDHARIVDLRYTRLVDSSRLAAPAVARSMRQERLLRVVAVPASAGAERRLEVAAVPTKAAVVAAPKVAAVRRERGLEMPSRPSTCDHVFQVVVMRVSLHCQGCAGKVKKHISKMEGVTSFSIDLESKRVTVMGHVSPAGVLESISKVKKAEFWPTTTTPPVKA